jgi:nitrite reductase (NO-forming)
MVAQHIANGMYGLIVVEPEGGLPQVDHEFYVMQGDVYTTGDRGQAGNMELSIPKMLDERPDYVVFNGGVGNVTGANQLTAKVGDTVRIFFGDGGPNLSSSFHAIGEIFDRVYPEGAIGSPVATNVQTTHVSPGGATVVEFKVEIPGDYTLVDHSLGRLEKGAAGVLHVEGPQDASIFNPIQVGAGGSGGH